MRNRSFLAAIVALILAGIAVMAGLRQHVAPPPPVTASQSDTPVIWSHGRDGTVRNAEEHWAKHGAEFPELHSAAEYERAALAFIRHPPTGTLIKRRENGDTLYYDPVRNTFAVADSDGEPRTFFKPDSGRAYWDRQ